MGEPLSAGAVQETMAEVWPAMAVTPVTADGLSVSPDANANFEISPDGSMLAMALDRGTSTELHVIDLTTLKARSLPALPKGIVSQIHWRPGSLDVGFTFGSI